MTRTGQRYQSSRMLVAPLHKRPYHAFLSYAHADLVLVQQLHHWLTSNAGLSVWLDSSQLAGGEKVAAGLGDHLLDCRAFLLVLSKAATQSNWVSSEVKSALHEAETTPGFSILGVRTENCEIPREWGGLRALKWIDAPAGELTSQTAWEILTSLHPRGGAKPEQTDIFVSCGWRDREVPFSEGICRLLHAKGARLIGDSPDQKHFSAGDRVRRILEGCGAHLVLLPARGRSGHVVKDEYKYFIQEIGLARELGLPQLVLCEELAALPSDLAELAQEVPKVGPGPLAPEWLLDACDNLIEEARLPIVPQHAFLAAEYDGRSERNRLLKNLIEGLTAMPCLLGNDFSGEQLRQRIIEHIQHAQFLLADLACEGDVSTDTLKINLNTCVEAGIAIGAKVRHYLLSYAISENSKTTKLPFMFRDHQIHYYRNDVELIGLVHKLALPHRRRVINHEIGLPR